MLRTGNPRVPPMRAWGQSTTTENRGEDTRAMVLQLLPEKGWRAPLAEGSQKTPPAAILKRWRLPFPVWVGQEKLEQEGFE